MHKTTITTILFSAFLMLFACQSSRTSSQAHRKALKQSQKIAEYQETLEENLKQLEEQRDSFMDYLEDGKQQNAKLLEFVKSEDALIASVEGMLREQKELMDLHQEYTKKHENTALGIEEIKAQHRQIDKDLNTVEMGMSQIRIEISQTLTEGKQIKATLGNK